MRRAVIVGSGIAGLSTALHLGHCTVVTKTALGSGSTRWAQGGLAAAVGPGDSVSQHVADTLRVSAGLGDTMMAELVAAGAPRGISWLTNLGAQFDRRDGGLALGREAGHSTDRIVHADGDATGAEVVRALTAAVHERPDIEILEHTFALDLVVFGARVVGLNVLVGDGSAEVIPTPTVVLAAGGIGQVYSHTTNPVEATGDGLAMAWRAGAEVRDCEFVQFHPTALAGAADPLPLLTEALRGAGARLTNGAGERFMTTVHDDAELAPRDVVARAIWRQQRDGPVYLDARRVDRVADRFPTAKGNAAAVGLDIESELLPVTPAQHYYMGGIAVDRHGRSSIAGLYAAGEVASTGLHGANRLASNSLVEGLVFGRIIAESISRNDDHMVDIGQRCGSEPVSVSNPLPPEIGALRDTMWQHGGIVRSGVGLARAANAIEGLRPALDTHPIARNLATVAAIIVSAASDRKESRGAQYRSDFPRTNPALGRPKILRRDDLEPLVSI